MTYGAYAFTSRTNSVTGGCHWGCDAFGGVDPDQGTGCLVHDELIC